MKKAAIIPVDTIGDALILMIVANKLKNLGYDVTILHDNIYSLKKWFPLFHFDKLKSSLKNLDLFDHIFLQQDEVKTDKTQKIKNLVKTKISMIYFRYNKSKFSSLTPLDIAIKDDISIAKSLAINFQRFIKSNILENKKNADYFLDGIDLNTGICIPKNLVHKKYKKRVIIQPSSSDIKKCWSKKKYILLAKKLKTKGFDCVICVAPNELKDYLFVKPLGFFLSSFSSLSDLASHIYESSFLIGNCSLSIHLASLLKIDHIMIANSKKIAKKWQGGWLKTNIILPPSWIINLKGLRLREKYFKKLITIKKVLKTFNTTR